MQLFFVIGADAIGFMRNKANVINKKVARLGVILFVLAMVVVVALIVVLSVYQMERTNLNGLFKTVECTVVKQEIDGNSVTIELDDGQVMSASNVKVDWDEYLHRSIKLIVPNEQYGKSKPWVLGLVVDDVTVVDFNQTITQKKHEDVVIYAVAGTIAGVCALAVVALYLIRRKQSKTVEVDFAKLLCAMMLHHQPPCKEQKKCNIVSFILIVLAILTLVVLGAVLDTTENQTSQIVFAVVMCAVSVAMIFSLFPLRRYVAKKEREFYIENYPFDFADISHAPLRKSVKEQIQKQNKEDRQRYPNSFDDHGNNLIAEFASDGLMLRNVDNMLDEFIASQKQGVFDELEGEQEHIGTYACKIGYQELNLVALPFYRKYDRPFAIVIKSRLEDGTYNLQNDVHFMLDSNLLCVLRKFDVPVEHLDYLLTNIASLMDENCPKAKNEQFTLPMN